MNGGGGRAWAWSSRSGDASAQPARGRELAATLALPFVLVLSLLLNLWGNHWGVPERWHPDEIIHRTAEMVMEGRLDPQYPAYGALHFYIVAAGAIGPVGVYTLLFDPMPDREAEPGAYKAWTDRQQARAYVLARSISGLMATGQVLIAYALGTLLFGRYAGLLAALFLAVAPYFVVVAHFGTVDTAANFWFWLSVWLAALGWRRGDGRWSALAALVAGLAIGTKLDRALVLVPLVLAHFLPGAGLRAGRLALSAALVLAGFVIANPYLLVSPFEFLDGTTRWLFLNLVRTGETSYAKVFLDTVQGLAPPLFLAAVSGLAWALLRFAAGHDRGAVAFLLAAIVPYYIALSSGVSVEWYVPLLFPGLALFAAYGFDRLQRSLGPTARIALTVGAVLVAAVSATKAVIFDLQFVNDSRYEAAAWIERHVPADASIALGPRPPVIDAARYEITTRPMDPRFHGFFVTWRENLQQHDFYQTIRQAILDLERRLAPSLGLEVREQPYETSPDQHVDEGVMGGDADVVDISATDADYVVLVDYLEQERIEQLERSGSGYRRVAQLQFRDPLGWNPEFQFVNPVVHVFRREDLQSAVGPALGRRSRPEAPGPSAQPR